MKKAIIGAGIVLSSYLGMNPVFSQKAELKGEVNKSLLDKNSRSFISSVYVFGELKTKKMYLGMEGLLDNFSLNTYTKVDLGANISKNEKISLNPQISFFGEKYYHSDEFYNLPELQLGPGLNLRYNLSDKLKGRTELNFPFEHLDKPSFYTRHSLNTRVGEFEVFARGKNLKENHYGVKFSTNRLFKDFDDFRLFCEYSKRINALDSRNLLKIGFSMGSSEEK